MKKLAFEFHLIYFFCITISFTCPKNSYSQIVLSEIMFDPSGSEYYDEFIEIYNTSSTDSIDLAGWQISDGSGVDNIIAHEKGTKLAARQFGLMLDPGYFQHSSQYEGLVPDEALILTIDNGTFGSSGLSNSKSEPIILISSTGDTIAFYSYSLDNEAGYSDEKIDLFAGDETENWGNSRTLNGTPGTINSVTPAEFDLAISDVNYSPQNPYPDDEITLFVTVENVGRSAVSGFQITSFIDLNYDGVFQTDELAGDVFSTEQRLSPTDSVRAEIPFFVSRSGQFKLFVKLEATQDVNVLNDSLTSIISVRFPANALVINEIMYSPDSEQPEWIEIYNRSQDEINIQGWFFSDSDSSNKNQITEKHLPLSPQSFFILAEDSTLLDFFNLSNARLMTFSSWQALNNSNDNIFLFDATENIVDNVSYSNRWGGDRGISLERINANLASNDSSNWSSCVDLSGGSPGGQNSIFVNVLPAEAALSISPNPFSPDGDGRDDVTIISYDLPFNLSQIQIKIYDMRGRQIKILVNNQPSGVNNSIIWDGKDKDGNICRMGIYIVYLEAIHFQKGVVRSLKRSVVLAKKL